MSEAGPPPTSAMRLPFLVCGRLRQPVADVVLVVGGDALEPADRDRLLLDAAAPAGRLAGAVAGASEDARKHIRMPVDHVGVAVAARRDQADIFGDRRVRRTGPLAIHDLVEIVRDRDIGGFHRLLLHAATRSLTGGRHAAARISSPRRSRSSNPAPDTSREGWRISTASAL